MMKYMHFCIAKRGKLTCKMTTLYIKNPYNAYKSSKTECFEPTK